jgi:predicted enzyme related to lactoylglutathione lyase
MKNNPVGWFEIYVQDIDRAKKFYESIFQLKLEKLNSPGMEIWSIPMNLNRWGAGGALVKMDGVPSGGNSTLVYFSCEDCSIEESRVEKFGGRIHRNKTSVELNHFKQILKIL